MIAVLPHPRALPCFHYSENDAELDVCYWFDILCHNFQFMRFAQLCSCTIWVLLMSSVYLSTVAVSRLSECLQVSQTLSCSLQAISEPAAA